MIETTLVLFTFVVVYMAYRIQGREGERQALLRRRQMLLREIDHVQVMHARAQEMLVWRRSEFNVFMIAYYNCSIVKIEAEVTRFEHTLRRFNNPILWLLSRPIK